MHFHLPKPMHGWREFVGEVGIIVVGVLIALSAEQVVETLHLHRDTGEAVQAVEAELGLSAGVFEERVEVQACLDRRLQQIGRVILTARQTHRLPDVSEIGRPPVRPIQTSAWSAASSRGLVGKFPPVERDALQRHHAQSGNYSADVEHEQEMWATLRLLEHQPGGIDGALLADTVTTLERLRFRSFLNGLNANQLLADIKSLRIRTNYDVLADQGEVLNHAMMVQRVRVRPICRVLLTDGKPLVV